MPLQKCITPFKSIPSIKEFDSNEFIQNLKQAGPEIAPNLRVFQYLLIKKINIISELI
jgi:hypothetical protein